MCISSIWKKYVFEKRIQHLIKTPGRAKALQSHSKSGTCRTSSSTSTCIFRPDHHNDLDDGVGVVADECDGIGAHDDGLAC